MTGAVREAVTFAGLAVHRPVDLFRLPATALPAIVTQRTHTCSTGEHLAGALRELIV